MKRIVIRLERRVKMRIRRLRRSTRDAGLALRCQIILHADKGRSAGVIAQALGCSRSWACRVIRRFATAGEASLMDRREDNGTVKLDERYLRQLIEVVGKRPTDYGQRRPTWTRCYPGRWRSSRGTARRRRRRRLYGFSPARPRNFARSPSSCSIRSRRFAVGSRPLSRACPVPRPTA